MLTSIGNRNYAVNYVKYGKLRGKMFNLTCFRWMPFYTLECMELWSGSQAPLSATRACLGQMFSSLTYLTYTFMHATTPRNQSLPSDEGTAPLYRTMCRRTAEPGCTSIWLSCGTCCRSIGRF